MSSSLRPFRTPPALLISSTASWAPFFMYAPVGALLPEMGTTMPSLTGPDAPEAPLSSLLSNPPPHPAVVKTTAEATLSRIMFRVLSLIVWLSLIVMVDCLRATRPSDRFSPNRQCNMTCYMGFRQRSPGMSAHQLSLIHISEPTRLGMISYA